MPAPLTELLEEQSRARLALRTGLDGTSMLSPWPMLRVTGRFLRAGLLASSSPRSMELGESQPRGRDTAGDGLFSCCWGEKQRINGAPLVTKRALSGSSPPQLSHRSSSHHKDVSIGCG